MAVERVFRCSNDCWVNVNECMENVMPQAIWQYAQHACFAYAYFYEHRSFMVKSSNQQQQQQKLIWNSN